MAELAYTAKAPKGAPVAEVEEGSPAHFLGLRPGDRLVAVTGRPVRDIIDYRFLEAEDYLVLEVERAGKRRFLRLSKEVEEPLGLAFGRPTFDEVRRCHNRCFFCFVNALPKDSRRTLFIKDDDLRLSFLFGNFVTLTNLTEADWERLAEQRLSPLYVSVHASEYDLRREMLGNPEAPDILGQLRRLGELKVQVHCQVVLCPGVNDGHHLERTISDLSALYPAVQSIAVVPVGTTRHRRTAKVDNGYRRQVRPTTPGLARQALWQVRAWQRRFRSHLGVSLVYAADELYIKAEESIPGHTAYDGYPQYQNGIGLTRSFLDNWATAKRSLKRSPSQGRPVALTWACGVLIAPIFQRVVAEMNELMGLKVRLIPIENHHFGPTVTVSGLLTGADVISALADQPLGEFLLLPRQMLDAAGERTLDNLTPTDLEQRLGVPVHFASLPSEVVRLIRSLRQ